MLLYFYLFCPCQVHSQFVNPTRERLKGLLHGTMSLAAVLYLVIALCGYLYAYDGTQVNNREEIRMK